LEDPGSEGVDRREIDDDGTLDGRTPEEEELFDAPPSGRPRARLLLEEERDEDDFPGAAAFRVGKPLPRDGMLYCIVTTVATVADVEYVLIEDGLYFESNLVELLT